MKIPQILIAVLAFAGMTVAGTAQTQTLVASPTNGNVESSPFAVIAGASTCDSNPVAYIGYSLDNSTYTAISSGGYVNQPVSAAPGWHTVYIKVWDVYGDVCVSPVSVDVDVHTTDVIPPAAQGVGMIQTMGGWTAEHDGGTPGMSYGGMSLTSSPSLTGAAALYANEFIYYGGERYTTEYDYNATAQNFFYDAWVYIDGSAAGFENLEFDLNHTMSNGITAIMGFQCDGWDNTWDVAVNAGSPTNYVNTWLHSYAPCDPQNWTPNQWHHVQVYYSHDQNGWVTYHSVWLDGLEQDLGFTLFEGYYLGWSPGNSTNFQIDGNSSGTTWGNVYIDAMTVYHW
jgi:hypothetical protein